jgi:origin recognition complex subunit 4
LYSLFDTVQASKISLLVLGISTRQDALDLLEKRVKSRFSHRIVFFDPVKNLDMFDAISRNYFDLDGTRHELLAGVSKELLQNFTKKMEEIYDTPCYKKIIKDICDYQGSIRQIATFWINVLSHLNAKSQFVEVKWLEEEFMALSLDSKIPQLQGSLHFPPEINM